MGGIEVHPADRPDAFVVRLDGMDQSYVDLADPTHLAFPYVRRLGDLVDTLMPAGARLRVVHVGGAGLTLPRYVATTRPHSAQIVLEPAVAVTELVRTELPLPARSGIKVRGVDGRTGLAALAPTYADLVVVDAFAEARVPGELVTAEACAEIARVLVPGGRVLLNLVDRAPFAWSRRALAGLRTCFDEVLLIAETATLRARRPGNLVVVAGTAPLPMAVVAAVRDRVDGGTGHRLLDDAATRDSFGGGQPFTDLAAEASPRTS